MSTRERWIVYPILFMTLGIALRDKITSHLGSESLQVRAGSITTGQLRCQQMLVDTVVCKRMEAERSECRTFLVKGSTNRPVIAAGADPNNAGLIETLAANGLPQVRLYSTPNGGIVNTIGHAGRVQLLMGDLGPGLGLFGQLPGREPLPLTRPLRVEVKPSVPQPPNKPAAPPEAPKSPSPPKAK